MLLLLVTLPLAESSLIFCLNFNLVNGVGIAMDDPVGAFGWGSDSELEAILEDVRSGLPSDEIVSKHNLSKEQLRAVYNALEKVDKSTKRILGKVGVRHSHWGKLYEKYSVEANERERMDKKIQRLREARVRGLITANEFDREVRTLVGTLLEKHKKKN